MNELTDVRHEVERGLATIAIDRPERFNAVTAHTVDELIACFERAWADGAVGVICLTGAGDGLREFVGGEETREGVAAFNERRPAEFDRFRARASQPI